MNNHNVFDNKVFESIANDPVVRRQIARQSHFMFFNIYFPTYITYPFAEFHKDIFRITEDQSNKLACILSFRNSGKSTIVSTSHSLWSILGIQQKKFVVIICQTQAQAKQQMANIKYKLEEPNSLLTSDLGPFHDDSEWSMSSIVFDNLGARITVASIDQSIRGIRHFEHRPDLLILDDVEDLHSSRIKESRDKLFEWFTREVAPLGDIGTQIILLGNLLHIDSMIMRIARRIEAKELKGVYRRFPFLDENGKCLWLEKFDTPEKIEEARQGAISELAWQQEYLLRPVSDIDRLVDPKWLKRYKHLPEENPAMKDEWELLFACTAVDPAFTLKETSDYSATTSGLVYRRKETNQIRIYILPWITKARLSEEALIQRIKDLINLTGINDHRVFVEGGGAQVLIAQHMQDAGLSAIDVPTRGLSKKERLYPAAGHIERGNVWFPEAGANTDEMIKEVTEFPAGSNDDLVDSFSLLVNKTIDIARESRQPNITEYYKEMGIESQNALQNEKGGLPPMAILANIVRNCPSYGW